MNIFILSFLCVGALLLYGIILYQCIAEMANPPPGEIQGGFHWLPQPQSQDWPHVKKYMGFFCWLFGLNLRLG